MKTRESFARELEELEMTVDGLKEEVRLHEYCRREGLDFHDSTDYSRAVIALRKRTKSSEPESCVPVGDGPADKLRLRNRVAEDAFSCYTKEEATEKLSFIAEELENVSQYGFFKDLGRNIKKT